MTSTPPPPIEIICSVYNGAPFLAEFFDGLEAQTHRDWRLWVRDDGSTDDSADITRRRAAADARVQVLETGGRRRGAAASFGWVLEQVPAEAPYIMSADADDVWLPRKIERTLSAMVAAERESPAATPVLVHTDLTVVDEQLRVRHPSFWEFSGVDPEPITLRRNIVRNVAAGPTIMMNRSLREAVGRTPDGAAYQDWWYGLVAAAFGKVVALRESTVLYRQHGANSVGARVDSRTALSALPGAVVASLGRTARFRRDLEQSTRQARAFLDRYRDRLDESDREFLQEYSRIPQCGFFRRKLAVLRLHTLPEYGVLRALSGVLRA